MRAKNQQPCQCQRQPKSQEIKCQAPFRMHLHAVHVKGRMLTYYSLLEKVQQEVKQSYFVTLAEQVCRPTQALR